MQSLNVVFHVGLNKLLNRPAYDVTVMDDLALGGASLLSAHWSHDSLIFVMGISYMQIRS